MSVLAVFLPGALELVILGILVLGIGVAVVAILLANRRPGGGTASHLVPCPDCGNPLSPQATTCPKCGRPLPPPASKS